MFRISKNHHRRMWLNLAFLAALAVLWTSLAGPLVAQVAKNSDPATTTDSSGDPEFEKLINVERLSRAWTNLDAGLLTSVAVDFVVAERVLGRPHRQLGVDELLAVALRLAIEDGDKECISRIQEIAEGRGYEDLIQQIQLAAPSRDASEASWFKSAGSLTPKAYAVYSEVRYLLKEGLVASDATLVSKAKKLVSQSTELTAEQRTDLNSKIARAEQDFVESKDEVGAALRQLAGESRGDRQNATMETWSALTPEQQRQVIEAGLDARQLQGQLAGAERAKNAVTDGDSWTLMLYLAADSNLERAIIDNLEELIRVGPPEGVNVIVLADRSAADDNDELEEDDENWRAEELKKRTNREVANVGDWSGARVFQVQKDGLILLDELGEISTGDPKVLSEFIGKSVEDYPAAKYGLILSGHGLGWQEALCPDDSAEEAGEKSALSILELRDAIDQKIGGQLDLLAFDCCLMANYEVMSTLSQSTKAIAASEETSPGDGWNYPALMRTLSRNPDINGVDLAISMGEAFVDYFAKNRGTDWFDVTTFSVVDTSKWKDVDQSLNRVSQGLGYFLTKDIDDTWAKIARAASQTTEFGKGKYALVDLRNLGQNLSKEFEQPAFQAALATLEQAINQSVVFNYCGKQKANSNGISIYLPHKGVVVEYEDGDEEEVDFEIWLEEYASLPLAQGNHAWYPFVEQASKLARIPREISLFGEIEQEEVDDGVMISTQVLDAENLDELHMVVAKSEGDVVTIFGKSTASPHLGEPLEVNEEGRLSAIWNKRWFSLTMGGSSQWCAEVDRFEDEDDDSVYYVVIAEVATTKRDQWQTAEIIFTEEDGVWLYSSTRLVEEEYQEINLLRGNRIRALRTIIDEEGKLYQRPDKKNVIVVRDPEDLVLDLTPLDDGEYSVGFLGTDTSGNASVVETILD